MKLRSVVAMAALPLALSVATTGWAQSRRVAPAAPVAALSEGELCSQGDAAACARGRDKWIELDSCQTGTARRAGPWTCPVSQADAAQVEGLNTLCQQGSVRECQAFAAIVSRGLYEWMKPSFDRNH